MHLRYRYRAYPNKQQRQQLEQIFGCTRVVYNDAINLSQKHYKETGNSLSAYDLMKPIITDAKKTPEREWLVNSPYTCLNFSVQNFGAAMKNTFRRIKNGEKPGFPKYKKKNSQQSASFQSIYAILKENKVKFSKLGSIKFNKSRELPSEYKTVTIIKESDNKYYISFTVQDSRIIEDNNINVIGLDLGISSLITTNTGETYDNPKYLKKAKKQLRKANQNFSRKQKGSNRREKARLTLAKKHKRVANLRRNNLDQITKELINNNQVIVIEDLNVKNMNKTKGMSKLLADVSFGTLRSMLEYKCELYGRQLVVIDRYFPSSQLCSVCDFRTGKLALNIRSWICPECSSEHDRDQNAAQNLVNEALRTWDSQNERRVDVSAALGPIDDEALTVAF